MRDLHPSMLPQERLRTETDPGSIPSTTLGDRPVRLLDDRGLRPGLDLADHHLNAFSQFLQLIPVQSLQQPAGHRRHDTEPIEDHPVLVGNDGDRNATEVCEEFHPRLDFNVLGRQALLHHLCEGPGDREEEPLVILPPLMGQLCDLLDLRPALNTDFVFNAIEEEGAVNDVVERGDVRPAASDGREVDGRIAAHGHVRRFRTIKSDLWVAVFSIGFRFKTHLSHPEIVKVPERDLDHRIIPVDAIFPSFEHIRGGQHRDEPPLTRNPHERQALGKGQLGEALESHSFLINERHGFLIDGDCGHGPECYSRRRFLSRPDQEFEPDIAWWDPDGGVEALGSTVESHFSTRVRGRIPAMNDADTVTNPLVGVIMGSQSDWETMQHASETLTALGVSHECRVVSAHRTPDLLFEYATAAADRGLRVIIAGAGGAAHLPGMVASKTHLPILGVPVQSKTLSGMDSLLSIVQMPAGVPVGTLAIGRAGAVNAGLLAASVIALENAEVRSKLIEWRRSQTSQVLANPIPGVNGTDGAKTS